MDIVLLAGLWLPASVWDPVVTELAALGHRGTAVLLPGVDDGSPGATLEDQLSAALAAVDAADHPLVVGHSAASGLAWCVADRRPEGVSGVVLVGGFPSEDGRTYADLFPVHDGLVPFPGWQPFEGPDVADLDPDARRHLEGIARPVPEGVCRGVVHLQDERRFGVPVVLVCPEFTPDDARRWVEGGDVPELRRAERVSFVDIDSGHWPMLTRPVELARVLADAARTPVRGARPDTN
jgi:pimeloyl-ACP methyl ester carboxylesterase